MIDIKYTFKDIIPVLMLIFAILTFLFGDNIVSILFSKVDIVMETELINEYLPKEVAFNDAFKDDNLYSVDSLRNIRIKNEGKSTKNLRLLIKLDGPIYFEETNSTEVVSEKKIESGSTIILSLDRLSHNSTIDLKIWLKDEKEQFEVSYTDDVSNRIIKEKSQDTLIYKTILYTLGVVAILASLLLFITNYRRIKNRQREKEEENLVERVLKHVGEGTLEEGSEEEIDASQTDTRGKDNSRERLEDLVRKNLK